jgi:hypothetical protein
VVAQYTSLAEESDEITANWLDPGFHLGQSVGGQTDWEYQEYAFQALEDATYARPRGVTGGPVGTAQGSTWLDEVGPNPE